MGSSAEIICSACGAEALVVRQPVYEGFRKTGEEFVCSACGHVYPAESDVPFKTASGAAPIFSDADRSAAPQLFADGENRQICRYCVNYVVNPFTQWCGVHRREVEATDSCDEFSPRENTDDAPPDPDADE